MQEIGEKEERKRECENERRNCARGRIVEFLKPHEDHERKNFRLVGDVAGNEDDGAEFAERPAEGKRRPRGDRGEYFRKNHAAKDLSFRRAQRFRGLFSRFSKVLEHGLHRADDEGNRGEGHGDDNPEPGVAHLDAEE